MSTLTNTTDHVVAYRDDAGKHYVEPGESIEVVGDQHVPQVRSALHGTGGVAQAPADDSGAPDEAGSRPRKRGR